MQTLSRKYERQREKNWKKAKITYKGEPVKFETYQKLLDIQNGCCAICNRNSFWKSLTLDHDHKTGEIRGILCYDCNRKAVGTYERYGKFKSEFHEKIIKAYLDVPPVVRLDDLNAIRSN